MNKQKAIKLYCDGGCYPNPGLGTWAFVCLEPYVEMSGHDPSTTSNRMELTAIIKAIEFVLSQKNGRMIHIFTDSKYSRNGFTNWMHAWSENNWKRKDKGELVDVKNRDLWETLYKFDKANHITIEWVKGHNGNEYNEMADQLVRSEYSKSFGGQMQY